MRLIIGFNCLEFPSEITLISADTEVKATIWGPSSFMVFQVVPGRSFPGRGFPEGLTPSPGLPPIMLQGIAVTHNRINVAVGVPLSLKKVY